METVRIYPGKTTVHGSPRRIKVSALNAFAAADVNFEHWIKITDIPGGEYEGCKRLPSGVPLLVPLSEAYYWTREWQQGEKEAKREIEAGNYVEFDGDDPDEIRRWFDDKET